MVERATKVNELKTDRRTVRSIKKFTDLKQKTYILASESMYSGVNMDGKIECIQLKNLLDQGQAEN